MKTIYILLISILFTTIYSMEKSYFIENDYIQFMQPFFVNNTDMLAPVHQIAQVDASTSPIAQPNTLHSCPQGLKRKANKSIDYPKNKQPPKHLKPNQPESNSQGPQDNHYDFLHTQLAQATTNIQDMITLHKKIETLIATAFTTASNTEIQKAIQTATLADPYVKSVVLKQTNQETFDYFWKTQVARQLKYMGTRWCEHSWSRSGKARGVKTDKKIKLHKTMNLKDLPDNQIQKVWHRDIESILKKLIAYESSYPWLALQKNQPPKIKTGPKEAFVTFCFAMGLQERKRRLQTLIAYELNPKILVLKNQYKQLQSAILDSVKKIDSVVKG